MAANFSFVIDGVLAGMERPGSFSRLREDLEFLKDKKIGAIVSLTETELERAFIEEFGFRYLHLPVCDFTAPTLEQIDAYVAFLKQLETEQVAAVVHCGAGMGRTGTMLACALVARGLSPDAAIERVRETRPYSIETLEQEDCVADYADILARRRSEGMSNPPEGQA